MTKKKKDEELYISPLQRLFMAGTGLGMIKGNSKTLKSGLIGRDDLWHGSPVDNLFEGPHGKGILEEGLNTRFSGKNKRLNSLLISNSLVRDTEEYLRKRKIKITPEVTDKLFRHTSEVINKTKDPSSTNTLLQNIDAQAKKLSKDLGINHADYKKHLDKKMPELGKRLYFGSSPESVAFWSEKGKNETNFIQSIWNNKKTIHNPTNYGELARKASKDLGEAIAEQATGGYYGDIKSKLKYGRPKTVTQVKDVAELKSKLKSYQNSKNISVLLRSSVPTKSLDYFRDIPVLRNFIANSPALKHIVGTYIPQSDPAKDLSISANTSPKNINMADVVDKNTGKVLERFKVKNYIKADSSFMGGAGKRLATIKKLTIPGVATAVGGTLLYKGLTGHSLTSDLSKKGREKRAAVNYKVLAKAGLYPTAIVGGTSALTMLAAKKMGLEAPEHITTREAKNMSKADKLRYEASSARFNSRLGLMSGMATGVAGALAGAYMGRKLNPLVGGAAGLYAAGILNAGISQTPHLSRTLKKDPEHSGSLLAILAKNEKIKKHVQDNADAYTAAEVGGTVGLTAALPYYIAKKYYPYHSEYLKAKVSETITNPQVVNKVRSLQDYYKKLPMSKKLLAAAALGGATLGLPVLKSALGESGAAAMDLAAKGLDKYQEGQDDKN